MDELSPGALASRSARRAISEQGRFDWGQTEVGPRPWARDPTPSRPLEETLLEKVGLVGVLDGVGFLPHTLRERRQANRSACETVAEHLEDRAVDLVETEFVDPEDLETVHCRVAGDPPLGPHLDEVTNAPEKAVGDARRASRGRRSPSLLRHRSVPRGCLPNA